MWAVRLNTNLPANGPFSSYEAPPNQPDLFDHGINGASSLPPHLPIPGGETTPRPHDTAVEEGKDPLANMSEDGRSGRLTAEQADFNSRFNNENREFSQDWLDTYSSTHLRRGRIGDVSWTGIMDSIQPGDSTGYPAAAALQPSGESFSRSETKQDSKSSKRPPTDSTWDEESVSDKRRKVPGMTRHKPRRGAQDKAATDEATEQPNRDKWACLYFAFNPARFGSVQNCCGPGFGRVSDVKYTLTPRSDR